MKPEDKPKSGAPAGAKGAAVGAKKAPPSMGDKLRRAFTDQFAAPVLGPTGRKPAK